MGNTTGRSWKMDGYDEDTSNILTVKFDPGPDGIGKLTVRGAFGGFSGESGAWFNSERLNDFATPLATCPIGENDAPAIAGGFQKEGDGPHENWSGRNVGQSLQNGNGGFRR